MNAVERHDNDEDVEGSFLLLLRGVFADVKGSFLLLLRGAFVVVVELLLLRGVFLLLLRRVFVVVKESFCCSYGELLLLLKGSVLGILIEYKTKLTAGSF